MVTHEEAKLAAPPAGIPTIQSMGGSNIHPKAAEARSSAHENSSKHPWLEKTNKWMLGGLALFLVLGVFCLIPSALGWWEQMPHNGTRYLKAGQWESFDIENGKDFNFRPANYGIRFDYLVNEETEPRSSGPNGEFVKFAPKSDPHGLVYRISLRPARDMKAKIWFTDVVRRVR